MKLKSLIAMCKNRGSMFLYDRVNESGETTEQWLGTGETAYSLAGLPYMTEEQLLRLCDITAKQREAMHFTHTKLPDNVNFNDADDGEARLDELDVTLGYKGRRIRPYLTSSGPEFMDCAYLAPLADAGIMLAIYERTRTNNGQVYFAAKAGLLLVGVIMPVRELEEPFVEQLETLANGLRATIDARQDSADDEQIEI